MLRYFLLSCLLTFLVFPAFAQVIVIRQNNTNAHDEFGIIAFNVNSALLNNDFDKNNRVNLSKCTQNKKEIKALSDKFRKLYPGISYGKPAIVLPEEKDSDTVSYEQTYVSIKKKKIIYYLQLKITFASTNPDGDFYFPYIKRIEVLGPDEIIPQDQQIRQEIARQKQKGDAE
ncbi:MAG: hypothetical protein ACTHJ0_10105 [Flavipsychrobacter sp.]